VRKHLRLASSSGPACSSTQRVKDLTELLERHETFSFLRLGDGELRYMLEMQSGKIKSRDTMREPSCEVAFGNLGLAPNHYSRLLTAYERCSLIDLYGELPFNNSNLQFLQWSRDKASAGEVSSGSISLLHQWIYFELRNYLETHSCLFCGAESSLLKTLLEESEFRQIIGPFWPKTASAWFHQPRNNGASVAKDLDELKGDVRLAIQTNGIDTLFLSLGGGAKILCYELAQELGVRAIDFGSGLRSLTYSGSDGYAAWRSSHHPHLLRVPFDVYMRAAESAYPDLTITELLGKAHAQLCLELQHKELLKSNTSDVNDIAMFDASAENRRHFFEALRVYRMKYLPLARHDRQAQVLIREFQKWRRKKGLGWDGHLFRFGVFLKQTTRSILAFLKRLALRMTVPHAARP
jgi:hypothetical protein